MMKREINPLMKPLYVQQQKTVYVKLVLLFVLLGVTVFLFSSRSVDFPAEPSLLTDQTSQLATHDVLETKIFPAEASVDAEETENDETDEGSATPFSNESFSEGAQPKCNLFNGTWVPNPSGPAYNNYTCSSLIDDHQNCIRNGRLDSGYLHWRWKPDECELPKFNPKRFLEFMRNKYFAFVGDSISRNHVQSILCMLSQVEQPKEIYHDEGLMSRTWIFPSYNFTVARIWTPFLLKALTFEDSNGVSSGDIQLHVDKLDETWTGQYQKFDYMMISGGQWYMKTAIYYENNTPTGCHYCHKENLTEIGFDVVYRKAIKTVLNFVTISTHKPRVFLRTISPSHFEGGEWSTGGTCRRKVPFKENEVNMTNVDKLLYDIQLQEFEAAVSEASANGVDLKLFDTTRLSLLRADGHPGEYRHFQPFAKDKNAKVQSDCLHWCLPGPIDSWNDLLLETLMNSNKVASVS